MKRLEREQILRFSVFIFIRTHLEEREVAEQRSEASHKRLLSFLQMASSALCIENGIEPQNAHEKLSAKLVQLVQVNKRLFSH